MIYSLLLILIAFIGMLSGLLSGMLGIGGGSVRIPLLNLIGFSLLSSFGINLIIIPISSLIGMLSHRKNLQLKSGICLAVGGSLGTMLGVLIAFYLSINPIALAIVFFLASLITVVGLNLYKFSPKTAEKLDHTPFNIIMGGFILNIITGMKGGSGGSLFPPLLRFLKYDIRKAVATSLFATIFTASIGIAMFWSKGEIKWIEGLITLLGTIIGVRIGSKASLKTKPRTLEIILSATVILLALITIVKAL
ncbi:MAG: sulfite exporter TauE/SafE family protein [Promethearchaeota archaeon]